MDKKDELKGLLIEANQGIITAIKEQKEETDEKVAKMLEENKELKAKVEAIEKAPAKTISLDIPGKTDEKIDVLFKGYDISKQGLILDIKDESIKNKIAKMMIELITTKAAMNETTTTQGGYLVPEEYADAIFAFSRLSSVALQHADVISTSTDSFHIPAEDSGITVSWKTEGTALAASDPTFRDINLTPKKLGAYSTASNELLADSKYDIVSRLTQQYGESIGQEIDNQTFNGTEFTGLIDAPAINIVEIDGTANTTANIDFTLPSNAIAAIPSNKIMGAKFWMHRSFLHYFRSAKDDQNRPILDVRDGGFFIYGYPVVLVESMPTTAAEGSVVGLFGNLKYYAIARRLGAMQLEIDPYGKFLEYQTRFRSVTRWAGAPTGASGFAQMEI